MGLECRLLGPLTVAVDGAPLELSSRRQRALLALLALHAGQVLSVERLVDDLWGERPPATARHALQVHVSALRKSLGPDRLATQRPGYVLRLPAHACDVHRFERLAAAGKRALQAGRPDEASSTLATALALWRGPALADLLTEPALADRATRLEELRLDALQDRATADLQLGRHAALVAELEVLAGRHPHREQLWALLMLAHYRSGRQVEALRAYRTLRTRLVTDLGLEPGPELQQLQAAVLRQDETLDVCLAAAPPSSPVPQLVTPPEPEDFGSRRVTTVLVAGLVGFDSVARRLDPEDLRALLDLWAVRSAEIVVAYGGVLDAVLDGQLMAVFGAPEAHEDDPERGVRAALDLQRAVRAEPERFAGTDLSVGVATGEVLFGVAGPAPRRRAVTGAVVDEARRLQALSGQGGVVVDRATHVSSRSAVHDRERPDGSFAVSGVAPVRPSRPSDRTPLVGREAELATLTGAWRRCVAERRPHLVSVLGEPGVGKSRQLAEFARLPAAEGRLLTGRCLPYGEARSYAPLSQILRQAAGVPADVPPAAARLAVGTLTRSLELGSSSADDVARHLALLTGLDDEQDRALGLVDERTLHAAARRLLEALAKQSPLCVVVEDVHWADDALLDLVQLVARRARDVPLLLVTLARPELVERRNDWGGGVPSFTSILLSPLDGSSTRALVHELGRAHGLREPQLEVIARTSGGNPLFAEELVATVAEGGSPDGVPASLTSLLLARLDALPREQQTALRLASVLGMTCWPRGVAALAQATRRTTEPITADLDSWADLEDRDLLRREDRSSLPEETAWSFKHALIREAAYASLPRSQRSVLHRAAEQWLSEQVGDRSGEFSEQLAHHAVASGQPARALEHLLTAADRARRAAAHRREAALVQEAMDLAAASGPHALVPGLRARRGRALSRAALWADARPELELALSALPAATVDDLRQRAEVHCDLSTACFWLLDTPAIREHALAALQIAEQIGARDLQLAARAQVTSADSASGDVDHVLSGGRALVADAGRWGLEPPYERLGTYSLQLYLTGSTESALAVSQAAVRRGQEAGDTQGALWSMPHIGMAAAAAGRYDEAAAVFDEARRFGEEYELLAGLARSIAMSAGFHLDLFDFTGAEALQEEARERGQRDFLPSAVSAGIDLLFTLVRRGDVGPAEHLTDTVASQVVQGQGWHGWLWRLRFAQLRAELAAAKGDHRHAVELARSAVDQSCRKHRGKYEVFGRVTLGRSLVALGYTHEALAELRRATDAAEAFGSPAVRSLAAGTLLAVEPDAEAAAAGRAAVDEVLSALSDARLRAAFLRAEPVRTVTSS